MSGGSAVHAPRILETGAEWCHDDVADPSHFRNDSRHHWERKRSISRLHARPGAPPAS